MTRYRYPLPRAYRPRYPYKYRKGGTGADKGAGLVLGAIGAVLALGAGAGTVAAHHAPPHHTAPAPAVTAASPASGSETAFWVALLADLGAPANQANLGSLDSWLPHEEPWPSLAQWNPLDSTQPEPGSWVFNSVGVQNYPNAAEGAQADAATIDNGNYPLIVAAFRAGNGVCGSSFAGEFDLWSDDGYSEVC
jgi:hypothetical protein